MTLERPELFNGRDYLWFLLLCTVLALISLAVEYRSYTKLTAYDDAVIDAEVIHQYTKYKKGRAYQVLKLRTDEAAQFYTVASVYLRNLQGYRLKLILKSSRLTYACSTSDQYCFSTMLCR